MKRKIYLIAALLVFTVSRPAHAVSLFTETALNVSRMWGGDPFFGAGTPSVSGVGFGIVSGIYLSTGDGRNAVDVQIGIQPRYNIGSESQISYNLFTIYPEVRIQFSRLFLAAGATPFVMKSSSLDPAATALTRVMPAIAYLGELGLLWPITPDFSWGFVGSIQYINREGTMSPRPIVDVGMLLRFYIDIGSRNGADGGRGSNEFKGWRYPFGFMK